MHVIKRDGTRVLFNPDKIVNAIVNDQVPKDIDSSFQ